jgi:hypothetical protein
MTETGLETALRTIADGATVPPMPADLWWRGRRRYRWRVGGAALAVTAVLGALAALPAVVSPAAADRPAAPEVAVPTEVHAPLPWQRTVRQEPAGRAVLIVSGEGPFRGSDVFGGVEGRTVVVTASGLYRLVNGAAEGEVGGGFHISPDGRYLAASGPVDGAMDVGWDATTVVDLTTGAVRAYDVGWPLGWTPDGAALLVTGRGLGDGVAVLDVGSGKLRPLTGFTGAHVYRVAISPDGGRVAIDMGRSLFVVDLATGAGRFTQSMGTRQRLGGPGAWTADGHLALWEVVSGCETECESPYPGVGEFRLRFLDPAGGADPPMPRFDTVSGSMPRLLGWLADGSAVVETYRPAGTRPWSRASLRVIALHPGGGRTELIRLPHDAHHVDIPRDLLVAGRFGGDPPSTAARFADWVVGAARRVALALSVVAALVALALMRRGFRRGRVSGQRGENPLRRRAGASRAWWPASRRHGRDPRNIR